MIKKQHLNRRASTALATALFFVLFFPVVYAQTSPTTQYAPLAPTKEFSSGACNPNLKNDPNCNINIIDYIPKVFRFGIAVAGGLAVIMIMLGGIKYITSASMGGKEDGKEMITNALMGLLLAIGAYIIINSINPLALQLDTNKITLTGGTSTPLPPPGATTCAITAPCAGNACYTQCAIGTTWPSDDYNRANLALNGITINNANCTAVEPAGTTGCTSLFLLGRNALDGLGNLRGDCPACNIVITGGTEFWSHQTHGPMLSQVDLRYVAGDELDLFIRSNPPLVSQTCYSGQPAWSVNGDVYILENNNHWHVCY